MRQYAVHATLKAFQKRVDVARAALVDAASRGPVVICSSWGKDSVALCDLALETLGPVPIMHVRSAYELPGGEHVEAHFRTRAEVYDVPAKLTLEETIAWLQQHGLGYQRETAAGAGKARKTDASTSWVRANGFTVQALGMRAAESFGRRWNFRARGLVYHAEAHGLTVACPLGWWSTKDVWAYLVSRGLPWHRLYDLETDGFTREELRNNGWLSIVSTSEGRAAWLARHFPAEWRRLRTELPQVELLK